MLANEIHIRDPFVLTENGCYYLYGTRAADFGKKIGGFDVYVSRDLVHWSEPKPVFTSEAFDMNHGVNWGTAILSCDTPDGMFTPHSDGFITPADWYALDGTLYIENEVPYMVFCHEHVQILNGTVEAVRLSEDLKTAVGAPFTLFRGSDAYGVTYQEGKRYITDGPFLYRHQNGSLSLIWSTVIDGQYAQCRALSDNGSITGHWIQQPHLFTRDGGHGMFFRDLGGQLMLTLHRPNNQPDERPVFFPVKEQGDTLRIPAE